MGSGVGPIQNITDAPEGSGRGAVPALRLVRFPGPPSEPDVRVSTHPALHEPMQTSYAVDSNGTLDHGEAMLDDR